MKVIVLRGQYNTGKTIVLRLLYAQLANFLLSDEQHTLGKRLLTRGEELFNWYMSRFES